MNDMEQLVGLYRFCTSLDGLKALLDLRLSDREVQGKIGEFITRNLQVGYQRVYWFDATVFEMEAGPDKYIYSLHLTEGELILVQPDLKQILAWVNAAGYGILIPHIRALFEKQ